MATSHSSSKAARAAARSSTAANAPRRSKKPQQAANGHDGASAGPGAAISKARARLVSSALCEITGISVVLRRMFGPPSEELSGGLDEEVARGMLARVQTLSESISELDEVQDDDDPRFGELYEVVECRAVPGPAAVGAASLAEGSAS